MAWCPRGCPTLHRTLRQRPPLLPTASYSTKASNTISPPVSSSAHQILSTPSWSIRSLLASTAADAPPAEPVTPAQLRHLLRLAALPGPTSREEAESMIATLQSQLQFVRAIQRVDTRGVEPLRAIRDETEEGVRESTVGLEALRDVLAKETLVGHYKRPKRPQEKMESDAENWDALATASQRAGKYFVVQGRKQEGADA